MPRSVCVEEMQTLCCQLSLSRFAAGASAGAARGAPGAPLASAADRPCPSPCPALSPRQRPQLPLKGGRPRSGAGPLLCPAHLPGALASVAAHDGIGINSIVPYLDRLLHSEPGLRRFP